MFSLKNVKKPATSNGPRILCPNVEKPLVLNVEKPYWKTIGFTVFSLQTVAKFIGFTVNSVPATAQQPATSTGPRILGPNVEKPLVLL